MKRKRFLQKTLSLLLAAMMVLDVPVTSLASEAGPAVDAVQMENVSPGVSEPAEDALASVDGSAQEDVAEIPEAGGEAQTAEEVPAEMSPEPTDAVDTDSVLEMSDTAQDTEAAEAGSGTAESTQENADESGEAEILDESGLFLESVEEVADPGIELADEGESDGSEHVITSADNFPTEIAEGETYILGADIVLKEGQQITTLAGTLDGKGHTITLADKPLAETVSGTIQNLGVAGTLTATSCIGSMAVKLNGGTILNSYSTVSITSTGYDEPGGLVGQMVNGTIRNSYYAGTLTTSYSFIEKAGLAVYASSGDNVISDSYYTPGTSGAAIYNTRCTVTNSGEKSETDFTSGAVTSLLNTNMIDTGFVFGNPPTGGYPVLVEGQPDAGEVDKTVLKAVIDQAEALNESDYATDTWSVLATALDSANSIYEDGSATQTQVNEAISALNGAISGLIAVAPVKLPEDESQIIYISSQSDFAEMSGNMGEASKGKYYVLMQDITVDGNYNSASSWMDLTPFYGVLDGQGHTITFEGASQLFVRIEEGAVVQNLGLAGTITGSMGTISAPLGANMKGSIFNCWSDIQGTYTAGFAGTLYGGIIANSIAIGDSGQGAFVATYNSGTVQNCYWLDTRSSSIPAAGLSNSKGVSENVMKSETVITSLNKYRGSNGSEWAQDADGWPYFGEDQGYEPGSSTWPELPEEENKYQVAFRTYSETESSILVDSRLQVSSDIVNSMHVAGTLSLVNYEKPDDSRVEWEFSEIKPSNSMAFNMDSGELYVYGNGKGVAKATQINSDGSTEILAYIAIVSTRSEMVDIKLLIDDTDVTDNDENNPYTIQGSESKQIRVKARYEGEDTYKDVAYSSFSYEVSDPDYLYNYMSVSNSFYFKQPGEASITVTSRNQPELSATVYLASEYVAVQSVEPAIPDTYVLHARNANSDGQESDGRVAYNPILGNAIVTPSYASNANNVVITSSNETIAYFTSGEKAYIPKEAGTVTFTATIEDTDPNGVTNTVTGSKDVTFTYLNPVTSVTGPTETIVLDSGATVDLTVEVTGARSDEGYEVTEPALNWSYSVKGIAQIVRKGSGAWKKNLNGSTEYNENDPDYGDYLPVADYQIIGLSEGTVVATGTPIDTTNNAEPIAITIQVNKGDAEDKDIDGIIDAAVDDTLEYISSTHSSYSYEDEWLVYAALRAGSPISQDVLDSHYASIVAEVSTWDGTEKPTDMERVALALTAMGKDITDVEGVNLAEKIYNSSRLTDGSNELAFALLALDAADISISADALWSRSAIIAELLKYQDVSSGGFGLYGSASSDVTADMTAMILQALANYQGRPEVKAATDKAVDYLRNAQRDDFGYGNPNSTAQVLLALSLLGIDPLDPEEGFGTQNFNIITNLMEYSCGDGTFWYSSSTKAPNEMATVQILQALNAYQMMREGESSYWNVNGEKLTVTFSLLGDDVHDSDSDGVIHTMANGNLATWIPETEYRVETVSTVLDLLELALAENGMTCEKQYSDNYIASITRDGVTLGEFTNGKYSGWKYKLNGAYSELGVKEQPLSEGDAVIFCYTDNYVAEDKGTHTEHTWDAGKVTTAPTCTTPGVKTYTCTCGETKTETIPATGHSGAWTTAAAATVFAAETQSRICSVCGAKETRTCGEKLTPTVSVTASTVKLKTGQSTSKFTVSGLAAGDSVKSWKVGNKKLLKVSGKSSGSCKLTAKKKTGKTTLTITLASGLEKKVTVKVQKGTVRTTKITGVSKKLTLAKGKTVKLAPVVSPFTSKQKVTYKTSNKKVATVTAAGKIRALKKGRATITVKSGSVTVKCKVTVK